MSTKPITEDEITSASPHSVARTKALEAIAIEQAHIAATKDILDAQLRERHKAKTVDTRYVADPQFAAPAALPIDDVVSLDDPWAAKREQLEALAQLMHELEEQFVEDVKDVIGKFNATYPTQRRDLIDTLDQRINQWLNAKPAHVNPHNVLQIKALLAKARATPLPVFNLSDVTDLNTSLRTCTSHITHVVEETHSDARTVSSLVEEGVVPVAEATEMASSRDRSLDPLRQQLKTLLHHYNHRAREYEEQADRLQADMPREMRLTLPRGISPAIAADFLRACDSLRVDPRLWGGLPISRMSPCATEPSFMKPYPAAFPRAQLDPIVEEDATSHSISSTMSRSIR